MIEQKGEISNKKHLLIAILFVTILILLTIAGTYAIFNVNTSVTQTSSNISANIDCLDITYSEIGQFAGGIDLEYNYPITDEFAMESIVPVTVNVTNNCSTSFLNYVLVITTLNDGEDYIPDNKIRFNVKKKIGTAQETTFLTNNYLNSLPLLPNSNALNYINNDIATKEYIDSFDYKITYIIDSSSIDYGTTNTYKIFLWIDYYEGDSVMYTNVNGVHNENYDRSTEGLPFSAALSLVVNPGSIFGGS